MNIASFIQINAEKFPAKPAIGFKKKNEWTDINWALFRTTVFKMANALRQAGVVQGDRVAIYSENSAEWITADLACLVSGAVTVPIYATNTPEQAQYIVRDSGAKVILAGNQEQYDAATGFAESGLVTLVLAAKKSIWIKPECGIYLEDFIQGHADDFSIVEVEPASMATLIYTSGTTGVPKGVMLSHGNFQSAFDAHFSFFKFKNFEKEHSLAFLPLTHVFEHSWTLLCLYGGAKVSFLENPKHIAGALTEVQPTMMCAVPRFYQKIYAGVQEMVEEGSAIKRKIFNWALKTGSQVAELKCEGKSIPLSLKIKNTTADRLVFSKIKKKMGGKLWFMPCGGASISTEVTKFFDALGIHITVGYGLTETTATVTAFPLTRYRHGSAGKLLNHTEIKIGEQSEILARGGGIMHGYYNKPEETAKVFTPEGWFKTGDAGMLDDEGNLFITDRIKDLMKTSNGKYIAPQPIENLLSNNNLVTQVMLIAEGRPFVSALIVPNFEALMEQLKSLKIPFTNWETIVKTDAVIKFYREKIDEFQKNLPGFERVKRFTLLPAEFEIQTGEITPTLKVKRSVVLSRYAGLIDEMYSHSQS